jgi:hypothetical protein
MGFALRSAACWKTVDSHRRSSYGPFVFSYEGFVTNRIKLFEFETVA